MELRKRIKTWRELKGWSQEQLAADCGRSKQAVQQWESGSTNPTHESLLALASAFGVSLPTFFGRIPVSRA